MFMMSKSSISSQYLLKKICISHRLTGPAGEGVELGLSPRDSSSSSAPPLTRVSSLFHRSQMEYLREQLEEAQAGRVSLASRYEEQLQKVHEEVRHARTHAHTPSPPSLDVLLLFPNTAIPVEEELPEVAEETPEGGEGGGQGRRGGQRRGDRVSGLSQFSP